MSSAETFAPFEGMTKSVMRRAIAIGEIRFIRSRKALWYQSDSAVFCCMILSGSVKTTIYRSDESALDLGLFGPGDWLGAAELIMAGPCAHDAHAIDSCELLTYSKNGFDQLLGFPGIERWFLRDLARRQYALYSRVELTRPHDRLLRQLSDLTSGGNARIECTQEELAESIGATRETVNRNLSRLQDEGIIRAGRGWIEVIDRSILERN